LPCASRYIVAGRAEIIERRFRGGEAQRHDPAGRVVDEGEQAAHRPAILEPGVLRAVDLHQLAQAIAPPARLMGRGEPMPAVTPQTVRYHPTAQRFA